MGKFARAADLDLVADDLIANGNKMTICAGQPATYAEATTALGSGSGKMLAEVDLVAGDYTKAAGDVSGRKATIGAKSGTVATSGTSDHVAVVDTVGSILKRVTTVPAQALTLGNAFNLAAFKVVEIEDPA
jgi:hypothetical protein